MTVADLIKKTGPLDPGRDYNTELINGELWIFFHASWSRQDWIRDFQCWPVKRWGYRFHAGYYKEFVDTYPDLRHDITPHLSKPIYLVGYSRGAAVALITHLYLHLCGIDTRPILLGLPRTLYTELSGHWKYVSEYHIIQYGRDLVTNLPPWFPKLTPTRRLTSHTTPPFRAIKDHGQYIHCQESL